MYYAVVYIHAHHMYKNTKISHVRAHVQVYVQSMYIGDVVLNGQPPPTITLFKQYLDQPSNN